MKEPRFLEFRIRKFHVNTDTEKRLQKKQPSRIYVNEEALIELTGSKDGGKPVFVQRISPALDGSENPKREATLWKAPEKLDKAVTQMYDAFRDACGYKLGEQVKISLAGGSLEEAKEVVMEVLAEGEKKDELLEEDVPVWEGFLAGRLSLVEHVHAGLVFKGLFVRGPERTWVVGEVNGSKNGNARYLDRKTRVRIRRGSEDGGEGGGQKERGRLVVEGVKGMDAQVKELNRLLRSIGKESYRGIPNPNVVLHGGSGTGKTMLLDKIAKSGWGTVFRIQPKDKLSEIQEAFQRARLQQPSVVLIDQFERLIDKERNNRGAVISTLCEALDDLALVAQTKGVAPKVAVIAACSDYTVDIPNDLKEPNRFSYDIYLPLPDPESRKNILVSLDLAVDPAKESNILNYLSERTHAYNGKDLVRLVEYARRLRYDREEQTSLPTEKLDIVAELNAFTLDTPSAPPEPIYTTRSDYEAAFKIIRPSAMHDINLRPPPLRWSDIGGQDAVKTSLRRAVRISNESPAILARYFDRPPKGFLLYGPPGCSKTMAAQAMATESGLNFLAVKGAELLNMYVGESERAVRALFQRAREVAPSIIFFDEIDSIGGQRHGFGNSSGAGKGGATSGVNVLTTLLNEMDGFEALQGVVVLAATNRPQALDPALLRPGRFDDLIYVSPPDEDARKAIFKGVSEKRLMHEDVDIEALARETEGYSGAEIKGICAVAGVAAYDRWIKSDGEGLGDNPEGLGTTIGITMEDMRKAIASQKRQITPDMIRGFEDWERQFRRH
ncbi:P-loop containing nucleoside triphosphate hydrolase protein [Immersiella caudata]|uniref:P-loop containing nucleoside triphosphate hydrolase protein n=1 Tax=Immersiella caudata TaxID=314043 RepID=A0AA39WQN7_9PEZI|nr:P-loop containing nucleoside triphosphate hydrolase protein [Immersiella caudata]